MIDSAQALTTDPLLTAARVTAPGALLTTINPSAELDVTKFATRDGELSYRDLVVATSALQVALKIATVWSFPVGSARVPVVPLLSNFYANPGERAGDATGSVAHVLNSSIPLDAIITDRHLYNRDVILQEVISRASKVLDEPTVSQVDGTLAVGVGWSQAEGAVSTKGVGSAEKLTAQLFGAPDKNLAARDNQLAAYVARMASALRNPFEFANRLLVEVTGVDAREAEIYVLGLDDSTQRIWFAEPALNGRMRIVFDKTLRTLQWVPETTVQIHVPQPAPVGFTTGGLTTTPLAFQGMTSSQLAVVRGAVPGAADSQFWRQKATRVNFPGSLEDDGYTLVAPATAVKRGGLNQYNVASLAVPGEVYFNFTGSFPAGNYRISALVKPSQVVNIAGGQNVNSGSYNDGGSGTGGAVYPGGGGSTAWTFTLPPGGWNVSIEYTSTDAGSATLSGIVTGSLTILSSATPVQSTPLDFVADGAAQSLTVTVTGITTFQVRRLILTALETVSTLSYQLEADFLNNSEIQAARTATAFISARRLRSSVVTFNYTLAATEVNPIFRLRYLAPIQSAPLQIVQLSVQTSASVVSTPATTGHEYWKREMLSRAEQSLQSQYSGYLLAKPAVPVAPPPSDKFADRQALNFTNSIVLTGSNATFSVEQGEPYHGGPGGHSGWWKWTAPTSGPVSITALGAAGFGVSSSGASFDILLAVYIGASVDALTPVVPGTGTRLLEFTAVAGVEYQLAVDGLNGSYGAIALRMTTLAPSNDLFSNAQAVTSFVYGLACSTSGSLKEVGEPNHAGNAGGKSAWWSFTSPSTGRVSLDVSESSFSTLLAVYTGVAVGSLTPIASSVTGKLEFNAVAGTAYKIAVDGVDGTSGDVVLHIQPEFRTLVDATYYWSAGASDSWVSVLAVNDTRVKTAFRLSTPGDLGKPALIPAGLEFEPSSGLAKTGKTAPFSIPCLCMLQPWMVELGIYVAKREFWPAEADIFVDPPPPVTPPVEASFLIQPIANPPNAGTVQGGGLFPSGFSVVVKATPSSTPNHLGIAAADIVVLVDESASMSTEHAWISPTFQQLEAKLVAAGLGFGVDKNRYGLTGFKNVPTLHLVGSNKTTQFGTSAEFTLVARRKQDGGVLSTVTTAAGAREDGYRAIGFALDNYIFRPTAVKVIVFITDEQRDITTTQRITSAEQGFWITGAAVTGPSPNVNERLLQNGVILTGIVNAVFKSGTVQVLGKTASNVGYRESVGGGYSVTTIPVVTTGRSASPRVPADYVALDDLVNATSWDLERLRSGGSLATSFTNAFVAIESDRLLRTRLWQFRNWTEGLNVLGTSPTLPVLVTGNRTLIANFV